MPYDADADSSLCAYIPARPDVGVGGATLCRDALVWQIIAAFLLLQLIIEFSAAYVAPFIYAGF